MRTFPPNLCAAACFGLLLVASPGCDKKPGLEERHAADPPPSASLAARPTASSAAAPASAAPAKGPPMPPRPVPLGSSGPIQPNDPPEQQMMAIAYTLAMISPQPTDPLVEKAYVERVVPKLATAARALDKGRTPPSPARGSKGNRKLEIDMGQGCTERTPKALLSRAGSTLREAYENGVLVVMCHDAKWACHQSTRDEGDVLCLAAPRR